MRSVVVLPAPLGPSRPVISPSRAAKLTPSTAFTTPLRVLKLLCRSFALIIDAFPEEACRDAARSRLPAVERGERRHVAEAVEALRIQCLHVRGFEEAAEQFRHAAHAHAA